MSKTSKLTLKENQGQEHDSYWMDDETLLRVDTMTIREQKLLEMAF